LFISDLDAYASFDPAALRAVRSQADAAGLALYVGGWSICPTSKSFKNNRGTAEELLRLGIRVAQELGSPVFRAVLGTMDDRKTEGGIEGPHRRHPRRHRRLPARCGESRRQDRHREPRRRHAPRGKLGQLIETAGRDLVGANIDSGNAAWTLEDPMDVLEPRPGHNLLRRCATSMSGHTRRCRRAMDRRRRRPHRLEGLRRRWAQLCPKVPIMIETISRLAARVSLQAARILEVLRPSPRKARQV